MLKEKKIHFLGTDMHNMTTRKPEITPAYDWLNKHLEAGLSQKDHKRKCKDDPIR